MTRVLILLAVIASAFIVTVSPVGALEGECGEEVILGQAAALCTQSGSQTKDVMAADSDHTYSIAPVCEVGGVGTCAETAACSADGHEGILYEVYRDGTLLGWRSCLTDAEAEHLGAITPAVVASAFKRLSWPTSRLIIQPPKGRTLVNFDTNVYTTNTEPTRQSVMLLGHRVTLEATPSSYTWHFDPPDPAVDPEADLTTDDPGAPYPDLTVTHRYQTKGTAHPSLETTYTGRYRIDGRTTDGRTIGGGAGGWHDIPETLTVAGPSQTLRILTATPHLVG